MSKYSFSARDLRDAAGLVRMSMLQSLPDTANNSFSNSFLEKMELLIQQHVIRYRRFQIWRRCIAVCACVCVYFILSLGFHPETRAVTYAWIQNTIGSYADFWFTGNGPNTLPGYSLNWIPDGYEMIHEEVDDQQISAMYINSRDPDDNTGFNLTYGIMQDGAYASIVRQYEGDNTISVNVNGFDGELYISNDPDLFNTLLWFDYDQKIYFMLTSYLDTNIMMHIANGFVLEE